jgi:hypothetical protein
MMHGQKNIKLFGAVFSLSNVLRLLDSQFILSHPNETVDL